MPSSAIISAETIANRLILRPHTVTLEAVRAIYTQLSVDAHADGHENLPSQAHDAATSVQDLIAFQEPRGLVDSARFIEDVDAMVETALELRDSTAHAYDRYDKHTAQAAEALEILSAYSNLLETADFELRTGIRTP